MGGVVKLFSARKWTYSLQNIKRIILRNGGLLKHNPLEPKLI